MNMNLKALAVVVSVVGIFSGCAREGAVPAPVIVMQTPSSAQVSTAGEKTIYLEDMIDGGSGEYHLISLSQTVEFIRRDGVRGGYTAVIGMSPKATAKELTATQDVTELDAGKLGPFDLSQMSSDISFPMIITRKNGNITTDVLTSYYFFQGKTGVEAKKAYYASYPGAPTLQKYFKNMQQVNAQMQFVRIGKEDFEMQFSGQSKTDKGNTFAGTFKVVYEFVPAAK